MSDLRTNQHCLPDNNEPISFGTVGEILHEVEGFNDSNIQERTSNTSAQENASCQSMPNVRTNQQRLSDNNEPISFGTVDEILHEVEGFNDSNIQAEANSTSAQENAPCQSTSDVRTDQHRLSDGNEPISFGILGEIREIEGLNDSDMALFLNYIEEL